MNNPSFVSNMLASHDVRPSVQRMAVLSYLMDHRTHPTAEDIHADLVKDMPTMSLTTVYNTLKLLSEKGVIQMLSIDNRNARFDYDMSPHAHFMCRKCGRVIDISLDEYPIAPELNSATVESVEVCYKGICDICNKN